MKSKVFVDSSWSKIVLTMVMKMYSKKKLKNNFKKALQFKFEQMAKKMREEQN